MRGWLKIARHGRRDTVRCDVVNRTELNNSRVGVARSGLVAYDFLLAVEILSTTCEVMLTANFHQLFRKNVTARIWTTFASWNRRKLRPVPLKEMEQRASDHAQTAAKKVDPMHWHNAEREP